MRRAEKSALFFHDGIVVSIAQKGIIESLTIQKFVGAGGRGGKYGSSLFIQYG